MRNQKAIVVLSVLAIFALLLLLFYDKIGLLKKSISPKIIPQKSGQSFLQATLPPLKDPELRLKAFINPAGGYQFAYRASYQIIPLGNGDLDLRKADKVLAVISVIKSEDVVAKESSFKDSLQGRSLALTEEKLNFPQGEGLMYLAKSKNEKEAKEVLIVFNYPSLKKSVVINVKNVQDWLSYPGDVFELIKSFTDAKKP